MYSILNSLFLKWLGGNGRRLDTQGVVGSSPIPPTNLKLVSLIRNGLFLCLKAVFCVFMASLVLFFLNPLLPIDDK